MLNRYERTCWWLYVIGALALLIISCCAGV